MVSLYDFSLRVVLDWVANVVYKKIFSWIKIYKPYNKKQIIILNKTDMKTKSIFSIIFIVLIILFAILLIKYNSVKQINKCLSDWFGWSYEESLCATDEYIKECRKNWENFFDYSINTCINETWLETIEKGEIEKKIVTNDYQNTKHKVIRVIENQFDKNRYFYVVIERNPKSPDNSCGSFHHSSIYCYFYLESWYQRDQTEPLYIWNWTTAVWWIYSDTDIKFIDKDTIWMDTAQAPSWFTTINIRTWEVYTESYDEPASERTTNIPSSTWSYILEK